MFGLETGIYRQIRDGILTAQRMRNVPYQAIPSRYGPHWVRAYRRTVGRYHAPMPRLSRGQVIGVNGLPGLEELPAILTDPVYPRGFTAQAFNELQIAPGSDTDRAISLFAYSGICPKVAPILAAICARCRIFPEDIEALRDAGINTDAVEGWYGWPT